MNLQQKIAEKRKELSRDKKGKFNKKYDVFLLWGEYPKGWSMIKDMILCFMLLNILIGQLQVVDYGQIFGTRTIIIVNEAKADEKKVQIPQEDIKTQHNSESWQIGEFTAYSMNDGFTPNSIMANGKVVSEGMAACPIKYNFGTKFEVGGKIYECADRMASRFRTGDIEYFDLYNNNIENAKKFGRQKLEFKILQ